MEPCLNFGPSGPGRWRLAGGLVGLGALAVTAAAGQTNLPPELWLTRLDVFPPPFTSNQVQPARFEQLRAEFLAGIVKVVWSPASADPASAVILHLSADEPGHWPARDWRSYPMAARGSNWETVVPVDSLDVPLVYFAQAVSKAATNLSPLRACWPRRLGLELPTRVFWPFIEGFEEGMESWRWVAGGPDDGRFQLSNNVKKGKAALAVVIPPGRRSVTLGTTRFRGWHLLEHGARGVALWMRTRQAAGRVRFTFLADAFTPNQVVAARPGEVPVSSTWQKIELPFSAFPKLPVHAVDFFTIELLGEAGTEFLLDELHLLGRWSFD